jgi:hypothetical protein
MSQFSLRLPFLDRDFVDLLEHAPLGGFDGSSLETEAIGKRNRALLGIRTNKGAGGTAPPPFSSLLRIFLRARGLMEKAYNWEALPYSLHHAVARADSMFLSPLRLNRLILDCEYFRHYNHWYRNELAPYLQEVLLDRKTLERPYWNAANLTRIVNDHVRGRRNNLAEIRKVLSIELMHRAFLDEAGTRLSAVAGMIPQAQEARVLG